jgi:hypothetical protein
MDVVVEFLGMTGCQSGMTGTALPITSALRFWPWGPLGVGTSVYAGEKKHDNEAAT